MKLFTFHLLFTLYYYFKSVHFSKNLVVCSSAGPKISAFGSHCSANFQPILDCFIPNFKLTYEDSENIKADRVSTVVLNLHQIKSRRFFLEHPILYCIVLIILYSAALRCIFVSLYYAILPLFLFYSTE